MTARPYPLPARLAVLAVLVAVLAGLVWFATTWTASPVPLRNGRDWHRIPCESPFGDPASDDCWAPPGQP